MEPNSFVNVTLSFWTDGNGLSILAQNFQSHSDNDALSLPTKVQSIGNLTDGIDGSAKSASNFIAQNLINSQNENHHIESDTLLNSENFIKNASNIVQNLIDGAKNQTNDSFLCFSNQTDLNDCLWGNGTNSSTISPDSKPDKVYWALFLVLLPILALFGNILVILR